MKEAELQMQNMPLFPPEQSHVQSFWLVQDCWHWRLRQQGWASIAALRCVQDKQMTPSLYLTHLLLLVFMCVMLLLKGYPEV